MLELELPLQEFVRHKAYETYSTFAWLAQLDKCCSAKQKPIALSTGIEIYPSDSTIHLLNNWGLEIRIAGDKRNPQQIVNKYFSCKLSDDQLLILQL